MTRDEFEALADELDQQHYRAVAERLLYPYDEIEDLDSVFMYVQKKNGFDRSACVRSRARLVMILAVVTPDWVGVISDEQT